MEPLGLAKPISSLHNKTGTDMEYYSSRNQEVQSTMKSDIGKNIARTMAEEAHYKGTAKQKAAMKQSTSERKPSAIAKKKQEEAERKYDAIKAHPSQHATFPYKGNK